MRKTLSERVIYEPKLSEEHIIRQIMDMLALNHIVVYRSVERIPPRNAYGKITGRCQTPGLPDLQGIAILRIEKGVDDILPFWIEVKGPAGHLRPAQEAFLKQYQAFGLCAFMARSWEEVKESLSKRGVKFKVGG